MKKMSLHRCMCRPTWRLTLGASLTLLIFLGCVGRTPLRLALAYSRSTDHFVPLQQNSQILVEPGAEAFAKTISDSLPASIDVVETSQYRPFPQPVRVYVCASVDSFGRFTANKRAGGTVMGKRLFISPKPENTQDRMPALLTHELSHLHLAQFRKGWSVPPSWFLEGLAVYVSNGGGAETVSDSNAIQAIINGRHFSPVTGGNVLFQKTASDFDLSPHMYYRQAGVFVAFLQRIDSQDFECLIQQLLDGESFPDSFIQCYGHTPMHEWERFVTSLTEHRTSDVEGIASPH